VLSDDEQVQEKTAEDLNDETPSGSDSDYDPDKPYEPDGDFVANDL